MGSNVIDGVAVGRGGRFGVLQWPGESDRTGPRVRSWVTHPATELSAAEVRWMPDDDVLAAGGMRLDWRSAIVAGVVMAAGTLVAAIALASPALLSILVMSAALIGFGLLVRHRQVGLAPRVRGFAPNVETSAAFSELVALVEQISALRCEVPPPVWADVEPAVRTWLWWATHRSHPDLLPVSELNDLRAVLLEVAKAHHQGRPEMYLSTLADELDRTSTLTFEPHTTTAAGLR